MFGNQPFQGQPFQGQSFQVQPFSLFQAQQLKPLRFRPKPICTEPRNSQQPISINIPTSSTFVFTQAIASSLWTITHNLGQFPSVTLVDIAGNIILAGVQYISANQIVVTFSQPVAGKAFLNY